MPRINLHTHTRRCRHAAKEDDRAYVEPGPIEGESASAS